MLLPTILLSVHKYEILSIFLLVVRNNIFDHLNNEAEPFRLSSFMMLLLKMSLITSPRLSLFSFG